MRKREREREAAEGSGEPGKGGQRLLMLVFRRAFDLLILRARTTLPTTDKELDAIRCWCVEVRALLLVIMEIPTFKSGRLSLI